MSGTPLLDIKPYVKYFDHVDNPKCGWYDKLDWTNIAIESPQVFDPLHTMLHSAITAEMGSLIVTSRHIFDLSG